MECSQFGGLLERIRAINTHSAAVNFLHLVEEVGELSTEIQIDLGDARKESDEGMAAEAVDCLICVLAVLDSLAISSEHTLLLADMKLKKWEKRVAAGTQQASDVLGINAPVLGNNA